MLCQQSISVQNTYNHCVTDEKSVLIARLLIFIPVFVKTLLFSCSCSLLLFHDDLEVGEGFRVVLVKRLTFGKGELLEGHAWSSDEQIFAVAGCKIYLSKVSIIHGVIFLTQELIYQYYFLVLQSVVFLIRSVRDLPVFTPFPCITCQKTFP